MGYEVLVVDDSRTVRSMVKKSIKLSGLEVNQVYEAANGKEALDILSSNWIDVVLADVHMPEMSGIELVEEMSKDSILVSIPVVMVSSDRNQAHIDKLEKLGIRAYIKKPFRPECFRDIVGDVLGAMGDRKHG